MTKEEALNLVYCEGRIAEGYETDKDVVLAAVKTFNGRNKIKCVVGACKGIIKKHMSGILSLAASVAVAAKLFCCFTGRPVAYLLLAGTSKVLKVSSKVSGFHAKKSTKNKDLER